MKNAWLLSVLLSISSSAAFEQWTTADGRTATMALETVRLEEGKLIADFLTKDGKVFSMPASQLSDDAQKRIGCWSSPLAEVSFQGIVSGKGDTKAIELGESSRDFDWDDGFVIFTFKLEGSGLSHLSNIDDQRSDWMNQWKHDIIRVTKGGSPLDFEYSVLFFGVQDPFFKRVIDPICPKSITNVKSGQAEKMVNFNPSRDPKTVKCAKDRPCSIAVGFFGLSEPSLAEDISFQVKTWAEFVSAPKDTEFRLQLSNNKNIQSDQEFDGFRIRMSKDNDSSKFQVSAEGSEWKILKSAVEYEEGWEWDEISVFHCFIEKPKCNVRLRYWSESRTMPVILSK